MTAAHATDTREHDAPARVTGRRRFREPYAGQTVVPWFKTTTTATPLIRRTSYWTT
jgi:hypothetical protein